MYPITSIEDDAPEFPEQLGTKRKFWLRIQEHRYLFKIGRTGTGENWAEKAAAELCALLALPHAHYELAVWKHEKGVLSPAFVPRDGRLIMGNELLAAIHTGYPAHQIRRVREHTVGRIHALLSHTEIRLPLDWEPPDASICSAFDVFIGYLLLDAWIANQDRHHENWGVINYQGRIHLAPSYDHAAALGQNETDETRKDRLETRDGGRHISRYVQRARSAIYEKKSDTTPLPTIDAHAMKALYIAWQDPQTRTWHTVGCLTHEHGLYRFVYTSGALASPRFTYLGRMHDLRKHYVSETLFPLFSSRLLDGSRPEYPDYVRWLGVEVAEPGPMQLLARSGGKRATDRLCVYAHPEPNERGQIELFFFSHGLRYLGERERQRIDRLKTGDRLQLKRDDENTHDRYALVVETEEPVKVGYCPRYLNQDLRRVMDIAEVELTVERANPDAPLHFRLLCKAAFTPPPGFELFASDAYKPLAGAAVAA